SCIYSSSIWWIATDIDAKIRSLKKGGFLVTLGEKLLYLRKTKGLSQEQLASEVTVSRQAISKWELGESMPDTENVIQLTKIFDVSADFFLNDEINIPIGTSADEKTEQDVRYSILKNELKDDSDKLALKMYEIRMKNEGRFKWIWPLVMGIAAIIIIGIYYFCFR
ncbi:MAG: helix-turn-helix domain-containing protein, partial [Ruminiclostridium sp.]